MILIVDDEIRMRRLVGDFLKTEGYEIIEAQDGKEELEKIATDNGVTFKEIYADAGNAEQFSEVIKAALAESGGFDILVNNAGITRDGLSFRMKMQDWDDVIRVNLTSAFIACQIVSSDMIKKRTGCEHVYLSILT